MTVTQEGTRLRREIRVPVYWLIVGLAVMIVSPILSIVTSVQINERTIIRNEQERQRTEQQVESARARIQTETIARYCRLFGSQVDVYRDAVTPVGEKAYQAWLAEYKNLGCTPTKR